MDVTLTPAAEKFCRRMLRFDGGPGSGVRLVVTAGGCAGLSAQASVEAGAKAGEATVTLNGLTFFLPAESRPLLDGVTIDFKDTAMETGFVLFDPKAKACGCGPTTH